METSNIKLYPEANERIADLLLLCEDNAMCIYAGTYIKSLEEQLKRYKGLEEQGKLLELPCAVGDCLYEPRPDRGMITEYAVSSISYGGSDYGIFVGWRLNSGICSNLYGVSAREIGKSVFLTQAEAEAALKEMSK